MDLAPVALGPYLLAAATPEAAGGSGVGAWLAENWLLLALLAGGGVVVGALLSVLARYLRLAVNIFLDTPLPLTANLQDYDLPTGEVVTFPSRDGRSLRGMVLDRPHGAPDRPTIIFCHEFGSDMLSAGRYAWPLVRAGYRVFTFDFRGHGRSFCPPQFEPRHWPSNHEVNDVLAAVAYVTSRPDLPGPGVGILGISRGASAAAVAAIISPHIRCLALDGVFSTDHSIDHLIRRWAEIFARINLVRPNTPDIAARLLRTLTIFYVELKLRCRFPSTKKALVRLDEVPALFIAGGRDAYVRPEHVRALHDLKPGEKALWVCPGAKHNQSVATDPDGYAEQLVRFFDRSLAKQADPDRDAGAEPQQKAG